MIDFEKAMAEALKDLDVEDRTRIAAAMREVVAMAVVELGRRASAVQAEVEQAAEAAQVAATQARRAGDQLEGQVRQFASTTRTAASEATREAIRMAEARVARLSDSIADVVHRRDRRDVVVAQMPRVVVLAAVALVALALGAGLAVLGASARRDEALCEVLAAEAQANELRAMGRSLVENYGFGLARMSGEVVLTLPEGSRFERVVPIVGAVFQQGSTWRINKD